MASLPFVGTLDSDDDVDQLDNESDSEEETEEIVRSSRTKKKGSSSFDNDFQFLSGEGFEDGNEDPWNLDAAIRFAKHKQESNNNSSSLQDKIVKRRELKKQRKSEKENIQRQAIVGEEDGVKNLSEGKQEKEVKRNGVNNIDNSIQHSDDEDSSSEDEETIDKVKCLI
nr:uncharacterized protein LOC131798044 [Pocillopora verrucosa]